MKRDLSSQKKVISVLGVLIVLTIFLTFTRVNILGKVASVESSEENLASKEVPSSPAKSETDATNLNFQQINFDISSILDDPITKDLPKSAKIELLIGETSYTLTRESINVGKPSDSDFTLIIPSKYFSENPLNLCEITKKASANKDLSLELHTSQTSLLWKYGGMLKYKSCLG